MQQSPYDKFKAELDKLPSVSPEIEQWLSHYETLAKEAGDRLLAEEEKERRERKK